MGSAMTDRATAAVVGSLFLVASIAGLIWSINPSLTPN